MKNNPSLQHLKRWIRKPRLSGHLLKIYTILAMTVFCSLKADSIPIYKSLNQAQNMQLFLTHPRTGTNWTIAALQILTHRRVCSITQYNMQNRARTSTNLLEIQLDTSKPPIYRDHGYPGSCHKALDPHKNQLFIIIRDPIETILRSFKLNETGQFEIDKFQKTYKSAVFKYVELIRFFDKWPKKTKHFFYYENLIKEPGKTLARLLRFLGESDKRLDHFISNIDIYRAKTLDAYDKTYKSSSAGAISKGKDLHHHAKSVSHEMIKALYEAVRKEAGEKLFDRYLSHYFEMQ